MTWTGKWGKLNLRQLRHRAGEKGQVRSVGHQSGSETGEGVPRLFQSRSWMRVPPTGSEKQRRMCPGFPGFDVAETILPILQV